MLYLNIEFVKIRGKFVPIHCSGRGYVRVGETCLNMSDDFKSQINNMSFENHFKPWQKEMNRLLEKAIKIERKRLK